MWRENSYENKLVWVLVVLVIMVLALTALWLYQSNLVTFGLKHTNTDDCPDDGTTVITRDQSFDGKCANPITNN